MEIFSSKKIHLKGPNLHGTSRSKSRLRGVAWAKVLETFRPASHSTPLVSLEYASGGGETLM
jgi:hypothetical protein